MNKFKEFNFFFGVIFFDCQHKKTVNFLVADLFNIDSDLILSVVEHINLTNRNCRNCQVYIFFVFKKISHQEE